MTCTQWVALLCTWAGTSCLPAQGESPAAAKPRQEPLPTSIDRLPETIEPRPAAAKISAVPGSRVSVELKTGQQVVGELLKLKSDALVIDLGFDILRIPRDQIHRVLNPKAAKRAESSAGSSAAGVGFFAVEPDRQQRSIKELVERFGEGVVSIETPSGIGSGFILSTDGYALTNTHVVEKETRLSVIIFQRQGEDLVRRKVDDVQLVALNPFVDLALLKIPPQKDLTLKRVYLAEDDDIQAGDAVFAIGTPLGLERSVSQGIISTRNRSVQGMVYLQTTAAVNPGNSGGPLFNMRGEVIGVTNMGALFANNIGFAIPVNYVKDFLRNREAFAFDKDNPNTGFHYLTPPRRKRWPAGTSRSSETEAARHQD